MQYIAKYNGFIVDHKLNMHGKNRAVAKKTPNTIF